MHKITNYNQFVQEVMKLDARNVSSEEIAEQLGAVMGKQPSQLLELIHKVRLQNQLIIIK